MSCFISTLSQAKSLDSKVVVELLISIDYEGDKIRTTDLEAIRQFQKQYPTIKLIHFMNAAYFTKSWSKDRDEISKRLLSLIRPGDDLGVHIHGWKNFVEASGVTFKSHPRYLGNHLPERFHGERGSDVPLDEYSTREITQMLEFSILELRKRGFPQPTSFRAGGWQSGPKVWSALKRVGILIDSSAVPARLIRNLYPRSLLQKKADSLWSTITEFTKSRQRAGIIEVPNNMGLADYVSAEHFREMARNSLKRSIRNGDNKVLFHYGFHQETARLYLDEVSKVIDWLTSLEKEGKITLLNHSVIEHIKSAGLYKAYEELVADNANRCRRSVRK
ncbi:MAG: hypothetical protein KDD61_06210 [Bdellovibrionales bacterium]|nr:hypothetical protein [Bdellovibrionales bacterium]